MVGLVSIRKLIHHSHVGNVYTVLEAEVNERWKGHSKDPLGSSISSQVHTKHFWLYNVCLPYQ